MYTNIGGKIKKLVKYTTIGGIIITSMGGIWIAFTFSFIGGILFAVCISLLLWISSFLLYGFGELIENSEKTYCALKNLEYKIPQKPVASQSVPDFFPSKLQPLSNSLQEDNRLEQAKLKAIYFNAQKSTLDNGGFSILD